ncbi:YrhA family protein [Chitinimonas naiadis]
MSLKTVFNRIKKAIKADDGILEPGATSTEIEAFQKSVKEEFDAVLPEDYLEFLKLVDGVEHNGLIIYGTKSSVSSDEGSELDLVEMNYVHRESEREELETCIVLAEDSSLLFTYNVGTGQFETRDMIGLDVEDTYASFVELLEEPLEYTLD